MITLLERGLNFGPILDYRGGIIAEEGCTTEGFVDVRDTELKINVKSHPAGKAARIVIDMPSFGQERRMQELDSFKEGAAYFGGGSPHQMGLAFSHGKSNEISR